ncbi:uncharacterized protein LOC143981515 [Lithobates pipiens]
MSRPSGEEIRSFCFTGLLVEGLAVPDEDSLKEAAPVCRPETPTAVMCSLHVLLVCPLRVLLLWALLCPGTGNVPEEIFTRPGSDLLLPIRRHLTLNHTDTWGCDQIYWYYKDPTGHDYTIILQHWGCRLSKSDNELSPNIRLSENGSLIIANVTPKNDGKYIVVIHNSTGQYIQRDYYTIHVEVPVSDPVLDVRCLQNGSAEISCWVENGTDPSIYLTVGGGLEVYDVTSSERIVRVTVPPVSPPHSWNIRCSAKNSISERSTNQTQDTCPDPFQEDNEEQ